MIIRAARIFPVSSPPLTDGAVRISRGLIDEIGPAKKLLRRYPAEKRRHFPGCVLLPGLVNSHCHLEYSLLDSLARPTEFTSWITKLVRTGILRHRFWGKRYWELSADRGIRKSLAAGITCVGDIVTYGGALKAAATAGIRMRAFLESVALPEEKVAEAITATSVLLDDASRWPSHITPGLSPHSVYTLPPAALSALSALASRRRLPLAIHAAETRHERELLTGRGPLASQIERWNLPFGKDYRGNIASYLDSYGLLTTGTLIVHGVHLRSEELALIGRRGASIASCPRSNTMLTGQRPDCRVWQKRGVRFAYGTDSLASTPSFDLFEEARLAGADLPGEPEAVLRRLTLGGAEALGLAGTTGSLERGKAADIVLLRLDNASGCTAGDVIRKGSANRIKAAMVDGRFLYPSRQAKQTRPN
jgi:cytosine/adenosine deaminase-related metal-dependent hydrolase